MEQSKIWDHFQGSGAVDDVFAGSLPRYAYLARQLRAGTHVLNIGVGRGGLEQLLIDKGVIVSSLDPGTASIEGIRARLGMGERARVGYSQSMPFDDASFDAVIMSEVLEHLTDDVLTATFSEVARVLKPDSRFIGTVPHDENLADNITLCPHCGERFHRWGHVRSFDPARLSQSLAGGGFRVVRMQVMAFVDWRRSGIGNFLKSTVRHVLGRMGARIAIPSIYFEACR